MPEGTCSACEAYTRASSDGRTCEPVRCLDSQYLTVEATCRNCPRYLQQAPDRRSCVVPSCTPRERVLSVGSCFRCGAGERGQFSDADEGVVDEMDVDEPSYTRSLG
jgi:hypothetical protein